MPIIRLMPLQPKRCFSDMRASSSTLSKGSPLIPIPPPCQLLRALNVDDSALSLSPTLLDCPITHLRLREVEQSTEIPIFDTLRCLELDIGDACDDPIPPSVITFLRNAPVLDELGIIRNGPLYLPHGWSDSLVPASIHHCARFVSATMSAWLKSGFMTLGLYPRN
ncbi:hypothetical protein B0H14DRAFT_3133723 [Mycena olivaceomarginata]|nr:hypothetical protein B0H14DRAFT_3133723 [Mycena olivaceomarginata]